MSVASLLIAAIAVSFTYRYMFNTPEERGLSLRTDAPKVGLRPPGTSRQLHRIPPMRTTWMSQPAFP